MTVYQVEPIDVLILSIVVLFLGLYLNRNIAFLRDNYIPPAVTGGLICSTVVLLLRLLADLEISFDLEMRDVLLLVFFSSVGLSAKMRTLLAGGKALALLVVLAALFLILQDTVGVELALLFGVNPGYGLMGGSISFAGGHGTAIAWGQEAEAAGLISASEIGIAFATFGLIAGGLIGGPIARYLIAKEDLVGPASTDLSGEALDDDDSDPTELFQILTAILVLAICVEFGSIVGRALFDRGVLLPGFLTSMFVGIVITNLTDFTKIRINTKTIDKMGEVSLNIFLAMSLMSMQLWSLAGAFGPIIIVLACQTLAMITFAIYVIFPVMGRDYDASVIASGFAGLGLGATPVAIANMDAVTRHFGASTKAFLIVPLVGAFFIDILNAATIKTFIGIITRWFL
ncbi:MAG: sodium/glutamate symporter [Geminicoccaceae bacterium]